MRFLLSLTAVASLNLPVAARAADAPGAPALPAFSLSTPAEHEPSPTAAVLAWLAENAPECPADLAPEIAAKFVAEVGLRRPGEVAALGTAALPLREFESLLWQTAAVRLAGPAHAAARETWAVRRVQGVLEKTAGRPPAAAEIVARLKALSAVSHRRLCEGKMEDEEIARLAVPREAAVAVEKGAAGAAKPKVLTAQEIVGEFSRRNQVGAAAGRLRGYRIEARVKNANGSVAELSLFRLRPNRFRMHLRNPGKDVQILACDGGRHWRQLEGKIEAVPPEALGDLRYLGEFLDPMFGGADADFARLPDDAVVAGRKCYQIGVKRRDGSGYVALVDQEDFRQLGRENADGTRTHYSDFRDFVGVTVAYREEVTLAGGATVSLEIKQLAANPGLITAFFERPLPQQLDLGPLEQLLAQGSPP